MDKALKPVHRLFKHLFRREVYYPKVAGAICGAKAGPVHCQHTGTVQEVEYKVLVVTPPASQDQLGEYVERTSGNFAVDAHSVEPRDDIVPALPEVAYHARYVALRA